MTIIFIVMFLSMVGLSWLWATGIDRETEYHKQNPDYKPGEGWLDWDEPHTEGEL